jgi:hypothetical protein
MKILAVLPIWGASYVDRFLSYTLPCLLAPGNLRDVAREHDVTLEIWTIACDAERLREPLKELGIYCKFCIEPGWRFWHRPPGTVMKEMFQEGFDRCFRYDPFGRVAGIPRDGLIGFMPLCADVIYSDHFFTTAASLITAEKRAVLTMGGGAPRSAFAPGRGGPPRPLMKKFLSAGSMPQWPGHSNYPAQLFFPAGEHGAVMRACHLYPVILFPDRHATMTWSHDNDLVEKTLTSLDQIAWMDDSDQGFFFGLHEDGHASAAVPRPPATLPMLEHFCRNWVSPWKAQYWQHDFVWHDGEMDVTDIGCARILAAQRIRDLTEIYERVAQEEPQGGTFLDRVRDYARRRFS